MKKKFSLTLIILRQTLKVYSVGLNNSVNIILCFLNRINYYKQNLNYYAQHTAIPVRTKNFRNEFSMFILKRIQSQIKVNFIAVAAFVVKSPGKINSEYIKYPADAESGFHINAV